ncbi:MAG: DinB family protein [Bacteroidota bacterium]|nr:DinB family protein [Bacteroidota bacterium]
MQGNYLESAKKQFAQYKTLGEKAIAQIPDDKLFWQINEQSNSIGTIVKHLWGNMRSRFTDFLTTDGEKNWRNREAEFVNDLKTREELMTRWNEGWNCLLTTMDNLQDEDLSRPVLIRNEKHSVTEAINRQLTHYAYHVGQIVFLGKMVSDQHWKSLSIPKGYSDHFNEEKFKASK